jgi:hypothetical protein
MLSDLPRIGILASRPPAFSDARRMIEWIGANRDVCIFLTSADASWFVQRGFEVRYTNAVHRSLWNSFWSLLFLAFGRIPSSKSNFFLTRLYSLTNLPPHRRRWLRWVIHFRVKMPNFLSFDFLARRLKANEDCQIDDIQLFFFLTELPCPFFFSRLVAARKSVVAYVHSWDHVCKQDTISSQVARYLVWSPPFVEDIKSLQNVLPEKVGVVGSSQFSHIYDFLNSATFGRDKTPYDVDYFLFAFSTFEPIQVHQEMQLVEKILSILERIDPQLYLVLRLYPMRRDQELYRGLDKLRNVIIDQGFRQSSDGLIMTEQEIASKYEKIKSARGLIHVGTTIGFEAAYFDTPIVQIGQLGFSTEVDQAHPLHLNHFIHAYQVKKYLLLESYPNVVNGLHELEAVLRGCIECPHEYLPYNRAVRSQVPLQSLQTVCENINLALQ